MRKMDKKLVYTIEITENERTGMIMALGNDSKFLILDHFKSFLEDIGREDEYSE